MFICGAHIGKRAKYKEVNGKRQMLRSIVDHAMVRNLYQYPIVANADTALFSSIEVAADFPVIVC